MLNMILLFIGATELIVIAVIVLLLFGGKKIPELMHGLGRGVKEFKDGMNEPSKPEEKEPEKPEQEQQQQEEKPQDK